MDWSEFDNIQTKPHSVKDTMDARNLVAGALPGSISKGLGLPPCGHTPQWPRRCHRRGTDPDASNDSLCRFASSTPCIWHAGPTSSSFRLLRFVPTLAWGVPVPQRVRKQAMGSRSCSSCYTKGRDRTCDKTANTKVINIQMNELTYNLPKSRNTKVTKHNYIKLDV